MAPPLKVPSTSPFALRGVVEDAVEQRAHQAAAGILDSNPRRLRRAQQRLPGEERTLKRRDRRQRYRRQRHELSQLVESQPHECQADVDAEIDQVLGDATLAAKPIGEIEDAAGNDALAEVVEDHDLTGKPADNGDPSHYRCGDLEPVSHPRLDGEVDAVDRVGEVRRDGKLKWSRGRGQRPWCCGGTEQPQR